MVNEIHYYTDKTSEMILYLTDTWCVEDWIRVGHSPMITCNMLKTPISNWL